MATDSSCGDSPGWRAALIHMHGNDARQRKIADSLNKLTRSELSCNGQRLPRLRGQAVAPGDSRGSTRLEGRNGAGGDLH